LLIRTAVADFVSPLEPEDLAGLACEEFSLARIVRREPEHDRWTVRDGPFAEADFAALPATDWTLLVQDVDKWDADVAALLADFAFLPSWRIDDVMVSYAVEGGSVGAHVDQYDVFLLQGRGRRRWRIDASASIEAFTYRDDSELRLLRDFTPSDEWILEPGDMLYLPPGVPHEGVALDACLTFSIGMRAPSKAELATDIADFLAARWTEDDRYTDPDLVPARHAGEIDAATLARLRAGLPFVQALGEDLLRDWFGTFITRYRSALAAAPRMRPLTAAEFERRIAKGVLAVRNPLSRFAWSRNARAARLYVAGEVHDCPVPLARRLCAGPPGGVALSATLLAAERALLLALVNQGHLALRTA
jgi:50S ribosomal protein L16 3-hydroxylase